LPAEGLALLATLDRAQTALAGEHRPAARAWITMFVVQVRALIAAGLLEASDAELNWLEANAHGWP
jgi:hypothetical protein